MVTALMICEIVSNGTLSLPSTFAVVGIVPGCVLVTFLGAFALFTSFLLIDFVSSQCACTEHLILTYRHRTENQPPQCPFDG